MTPNPSASTAIQKFRTTAGALLKKKECTKESDDMIRNIQIMLLESVTDMITMAIGFCGCVMSPALEVYSSHGLEELQSPQANGHR